MKRILLLLALCSQLLASAWATYQPTVTTAQLPAALDHDALSVRSASVPVVDCSFTRSGSGLLAPDAVQLGATGTGMTISQAYSNLLIDTGTTANAEFLFRSVDSVKGAHIARIKSALSQRIANQHVVFALADLIGENCAFSVDATGLLITVTLPSGHPFTSEHIGQGVHLGGVTSAGTTVPGRYSIMSVSGNNVVFSPEFQCTWTRSTTTATIFFQGGNPWFSIAEAATVSASSDVTAITDGVKSLLTQSFSNGAATSTFTCLNVGAAAGTLTLTMHAKAWTPSATGTLTVYGWNAITWVKNGTTATAAWIDSQRNGWATGANSVIAHTDAVSGSGSVVQFYGDCQSQSFSDAAPASASTGLLFNPRGTRIESIPSTDTNLYLFASVHNGVTAPASSTRVSIGMYRMFDIKVNKIQISGFDQSGHASMPDVRVMSMPTTTVTLGTVSNTVNSETSTVLAAGATYTGASRDAGSTISNTRFVARAYASHAGTLRVDHSTDGTTWRRATADIAVAADGVAEASVWVTTRYHRVVFVNGATLQTAFLASSAYIKM